MKKTIFIIMLLTCLLKAYAQDTARYSLEKLLAAIDNSYPQLKQYQSKISSTRALASGAKAWMPPTVSVALDRFPYKVEMIKENENPMNQAGVMVSVQQMIPNPWKLNSKRDYLVSLEDVQSNDRAWQLNVLHYTAKAFYYRRYSAERRLRLVSEYRNLLNLLIKTAKDKYAYNQTDLSTIFKAEASLAELANMETMLFSQIAESNIGLNTLMSRELTQPFNIDTAVTIKDYSNDNLPALDRQLFRSDILSMESQIKSMRLNQKWMSASAKPDFGIQFSHGQMFGMPNQFSIMGMMTIPIVPWSSRMYKSEVQSMNFEIDAMQKQKEVMQLMAKQMIAEKITMLKYERKQLDNYDKNILPAYKKNLESTLLAYKQNTGNFFVLLDAWNMLVMKEMERVDKEGQVLLLQAEYEYQVELK